MTAQPDATGATGAAAQLASLRAEHDSLKGTTRAMQGAARMAAPAVQTVRDFAERLRLAGAGLADPADRRAAQDMLDYWSAQLLALAPDDPTVSIQVLAPYAAPGAAAALPAQAKGPAVADVEPANAGSPTSTPVAPQESIVAADAPPAESDAAQEARRRNTQEQVRIMALARQWRLSGEKDGYLLSDAASIRDAKRYRGTDPDITAFLSASRQKAASDRRARRWRFAATVLAIAALTSWWWVPFLARQAQLIAYGKAIKLVATAAPSPQVDQVSKDRLNGLREISESGTAQLLDGRTIDHLVLTDQPFNSTLDFSGTTLVRPWLQRVQARANFAKSTIANGRFLGAVLPYATFTSCTLHSPRLPSSPHPLKVSNRTSFAEANLERADFSDCHIDNVDFRNADLRGANFARAVISNSCFANATLAGARFIGAQLANSKFTDADLTDTDFSALRGPEEAFEGPADSCNEKSIVAQRRGGDALTVNNFETAWWLANWGDRNLGALPQNYLPRTLLIRWGTKYRLDTIGFELAIKQAYANGSVLKKTATDYQIATALNNWAWHQVIHGSQLDKARERATQAINIYPGSPPDPLIVDTLGYVLLQLGDSEDAAHVYELIPNKGPPVAPAAAYHRALALARQGQCEQATRVLAAIAQPYAPTHERVLVAPPAPDPCPAVNTWRGFKGDAGSNLPQAQRSLWMWITGR